ncbi:MAG: hypothetical protein HFJ97_06885 [Eubacterium sp.]|nr:hypothetical protein [Eubacterium sp.]
MIFENTHPAIIDRETFAIVQNLREHRRRVTKNGITVCFQACYIVRIAELNLTTMQ